MGIGRFLGFRPTSKRDSSRRKAKKGVPRHRRIQIERVEDRLLLSSIPVLTSVNTMVGPTNGGTQVTIVGTNLAGATSVKFGTVAAAIVSDTATQIVVKTPASVSGSVDITVTTAAGTSALTAVDKFTYAAAAPTGPQLLAIIPNTGSVLTEGEILNVAPTQLTLQFNQNEQIDPTTLSAITITYTNAAGVTANAPIGYLAVNDAPNLNQVVIRFNQTLLSGNYTVNIAGAGANPLTGALLDPTTGTAGEELPFNSGQNYSLDFTLDLGPMVNAVVPQPVTRTATGQLQQAVNEIDVYFTDKLSAASVGNLQFYQLIATDSTANTNDQSIYNPTSVVYNSAANEASLYFFQGKPYYADPNSLSAADRAHDLNSLVPNGTQAMRLRIGDSYQQISTTTLSPAAGAAGTTYADALAVPSFSAAAQGYVISNEIETTAYDLQWPGGASDPGNRKMVDDPGVVIEGGFMDGVGGSTTSIPTYSYNFPAVYGNDVNGNPDHNQITPQQEQDTREIFELLSAYMGVEFEESTSTALGGASIGVVTGDLYPMGGAISGGGIVGMGGGGLAVMDAAHNWGTSAFDGSWMQVAMHEIMHNLGFGHSFDLPPDQIMGDDITQGTSELVVPGVGDLTTGLNLFRPDSGDINMYKVTLTTPGTLSAETIAQRLPDPSLLNTELRVFQLNSDGSYSAIAQNDDYFSKDSYVSLTLQPGTYFVGVSASGNNSYDPSIPNSGMNGTTTGPYQLRVDFTPQETLGPAQASASGNIVLTGANLAVNTGTTPFTQTPGSGQVTIKQIDQADVPSVAALNGETFSVTQGSVSYTFQFVDTLNESNQAAAGNIPIDFNSTTDTIDTVRADMVTAINDVFTVLVGATGVPLDGDADGTPGGLYNYWFNVAGEETSGANDRTIFVDKSAPSGGTGGIAAPYTTISAALAAAASDAKLGLHDIVRVEGNNTGNLSADQSYNIGTDIFGKALSDGSTMVVPEDTTVMIDAGAVLKLYGANIQVGSSDTSVNLSGASLQVLGTPLNSVYFTSWQDSSIGQTNNPTTTAPRAGDWGGIVFRNDVDLAYNDSTPPPATPRPDPEANGIFLDYVNHADLLYGGGVVSSDSVPATYDPIYLVEARPTISYNVIEHSADAAMSADPNSFQESLFEGDNATTGYYTDDYDRVGPSLNANLLLNNTINGMLVRIRTNAGEPIDTLTTTAQFDAQDITYVVPENLEIAGNPGGPVISTGNTTSLLRAGAQQIQAVSGASINDGDTFTITNANTPNGVVFEFDGVSFSVLSGSSFSDGDLLTVADPANPGSDQTYEFETADQAVTNPNYVKITFDPGDTPGQIEAAIAAAINGAGDTTGNVVLTGGNIAVKTGTTLFTQVAGSGGVTIQGVNQTNVPRVATLNGETFTVAQGSTSYTFQFVDTSNAANQAAAGNTAIDFDSTTDTIAMVRDAMVAAINSAFNGSLNATGLQAFALPYVGSGGDTATVPGTVALENITATEGFTFMPVGATTGLTVVGTPGVAAGNQRVAFDASQSPDQIALEIQAAIIASGLYPASAVTVQGSLVTIIDPTASIAGLTESTARLHGSLVIDPGVVVKFNGSRIEAELGATLIAEGTANDPVVFTSVEDDRYGAGGTFDVTGDGYTPYNPIATTAPTKTNTPQPGDWGGILADPVSQVSIDHAVIAFAGGVTSIEGGFAAFNAVETRQGQLRLTNSLLEFNADGAAAGTDPDRAGRGSNGPGTIWVLGAQPVIVDNTLLDNNRDRGGTTNDGAAAISMDVNSLNSDLINDWGRATGPLDAFTQYDGNFGPLVRGNILQNNGLNGMLVRSGVLSTQSVWDDTDIVYIVEGDISVPNLHTYGGLRLQSSDDASLVVKLLGADAGFTAAGRTLDTTDRVGGEVQIIGQPGFPVILTSLNDNTVGAGFDLSGNPQDDTINNPNAVAAAGDWNSVLIEQYSNDTNVQVVSGLDAATGTTADTHSTPATAQYLGQLAASADAGDDTQRLGFEVHGAINYDDPSSVDVYSFTATAGTDVYIAMDLTSFSLDSVVELVDSAGNVIARSDNKTQEDPSLGGNTIYLTGSALPFQEGDLSMPNDNYSDNADDPALRVVLPGPTGEVQTYYVRVYSALNIGHIDTTDVPKVAALNGTTFQVADSNTLAIGDIDTSHVLPGIGNIDAAHVASVASLNLKTFSLTAGSTTVTFQFVDTSNAANTAAAGNTAIDFNSTTDSLATVRSDMAQAITSAGLGLTATAYDDGSIGITGATFAFAAGTTPFQQQILTSLNGTTFQITDGAGKTVVFQFVDSSSSLVATKGDTVISYNSTTDTVDSIRGDMLVAINTAGLACAALEQADGSISITGLNVVLDLGQTPFLSVGSTHKGATFEFIDTHGTTAPTAGDQVIYYNSTTDTIDDIRNDMVLAINADANCGVTAQARPDGTIGLYGYKITFAAGSTPFVQFGRSSGSYQLQVRLQVDMDTPGSEVQYSSIRYATDGVDIQGMPDSSPLVTSVNSLGTNTSFANAQDIGNLLNTSNNAITVSGQLTSTTDVNWYKFELSYQDIELPNTITSFPLSISVNYADGLARPNTVLWVFDSTGTLIYEANNSEIVDNQEYLGNSVTNPNATSYGPDDPYLGPVQFMESPTETYYVAVTGVGMTADALQQSLLRQEPIDSINRVVEDHVGSTDGSGIADQTTESINLTADQYTLADVTMYTNTATNNKGNADLYTVSPLTGGYETDVTGDTGLPQTPKVTYGDIAMRPDGELYGMTNVPASLGSEKVAGQFVQFDTGDAANAISATFDGIQQYQLSPTSANAVIEQTDVGFNVNAMAYGPLVKLPANWPIFVVGNRAAGGNGVTIEHNLLYKLNPNGTAINYPEAPLTAFNGGPTLNSDVIPLAALDTTTGGGGGGNITGMAYLNGQMYCVDDTGDLFIINGLDYDQLGINAGDVFGNSAGDYEFAPFPLTPAQANGYNGPPTIQTITGAGPTLTFVAQLTTTVNGNPIQFEGLSDGPPDIVNPTTGQAGEYANTLFAVDSSGKLYALSPTTGVLQPMLIDGDTSTQMIGYQGARLNQVEGVAFSNVDYNLWHETTNRKNDAGHGINTTPDLSRTATNGYPVAGKESYYFGIENPNNNTAIGQVAAVGNYQYQNAGVYGTYNAPGGAHGSLESTTPFSLAGYTAQDVPTLSFDYYVDATGPAGYDTTRVFISDDGANWSLLDTLSGPNNGVGWQQAVLNLGAFAGDSNLQLRFDFSSAGDMNTGDTYIPGDTSGDQGLIGGAYLTALAGNQLKDGADAAGSYIEVGGEDDNVSGNFEFDLGAVLDVPGGAGAKIANGQTFTINDGTNPAVTFELDNGSNSNLKLGTNTPIYIKSTDAPTDIDNEISAAIRAANLNVAVYTDTTLERVEIVSNAAPSTLSVAIGTATTGNAITLEGDGPGNGGNATVGGNAIAADGFTIIPVNFSMTAAQVAQEAVTVMNATMASEQTEITGINATNVPKLAKLNGETFQITDNTGKLVTFEFIDSSGTTSLTPGDVRISYNSKTDTIGTVLTDMVTTINAAGLTVTATPTTTAAGQPSDITLLGTNFTFSAGTTPFQSTKLAQGQSVLLDATQTNLIHMIDHNVVDQTPLGAATYGPLPYSIPWVDPNAPSGGTSSLPHDFRPVLPAVSQGHTIQTGQENTGEGVYIDDIIVGFDERGAMVTGDAPDTNFDPVTPVPKGTITNGSYVLQIQRALQYGTYESKVKPVPTVFLDQSFNTNDRMTNAFTLQTPAGTAITTGDTFSLYDGVTTKTLEFVLKGLAATTGDVPIYYTGLETASGIASLVNTAINGTTSPTFTIYSAWNGTPNLTSTLPSNQVDLFNVQSAAADANMEADTVAWENAQAGTRSVAAGDTSTDFIVQTDGASFDDLPGGLLYAVPGDTVPRQAPGETIIDANKITNSLDWGIMVEPGARAAGSNAASPGSVNPLSVNNNPAANGPLDQVGGVTLVNNVISQFGDGGIDLLGDPDPAGEPTAAIPFFRVVNNTIYGDTIATGTTGGLPPVGINVAQNSAPTLLNNIIANVTDAVTVDGTSTSTVLGTAVYQNITDPNTNTGIGLGTFPISLAPTAPLFVDAAAGNFYLAEDSLAIDSALNSLPDRPGMVTLESSLGLPQSPIIAPALDELGQTRAADPNVSPPPGEGSNIFKDRGAIDRVDFTSPTATLGLVEPPAGSSGGVTPQWVANDTTAPAGQTLSAFAIQLLDTGTGIDNTTVSAADITVYRSDNPTTPLVQGTDYIYSYDPTNHIIYLTAGAGVWTGGYTYTIDVDNSAATGIKDIAGNDLAANRPNGTTYFTVTLVANVNFSHAPGYPVAWHFITDNLYLGKLSPLPQPYFVPSLTRATDDGVDFSNVTLIQGRTTVVPVTVTNTTGKQAYLNAWIDFDDDGTFTADDQVVVALKVNPGVNEVPITLPASAVIGTTWARFRVSTTAALGPSGGASDGEVEDYDNVVIKLPPVPVTGTVYNDLNRNGTQDAGEPGLAGWTVSVNTNPVETTTTAANGSYSLSIGQPGNFTVTDTPPTGSTGWKPTTPASGSYSISITTTPGQVIANENFGNYYSLPPIITSIVALDPNPTNATTVHYAVTFVDPVAGVVATDFSLATPGLIGSSVASVSPSGTTFTIAGATYAVTYDVTVNTGTGSTGTVQLILNDSKGTIHDASGNLLTNTPFTGSTYTIDRIPPTVASIVKTDSDPTNASVVHYTVTFSETVVGVGVNDFAMAAGAVSGAVPVLSGYSITSVVPGSAAQATSYVVTVNTGAGSGTLGLNVDDSQGTIKDLAGNAYGSTVYVGPAYTLDRVLPTATITLAAGQANPATVSPINFKVVFNKPVTVLATTGIDLSLSSLSNLTATVTPVSPVNGFATTYNVAVTGMTGGGTIVMRIKAGAVHDAVGNLNPQSATATVTFTSQPTVTVAQAATQANPINVGPVKFTVTFNQPVVDFTAAKLSFTGSTAPGKLVGTITGSGPVYTVAVSGMTATGRVQLSIAANTVHNAAGSGNAASTGTTNNVFYDITPPTELLVSPAAGATVPAATINAQHDIEVAYAAQVGAGVNTGTITDAAPEFTLSGAAAAGVVVNGAANSVGGDLFEYNFTGSFGAGVVTVNFIAGSFQDNAGNYNKAASYSFTVTAPAAAPSFTLSGPASGKFAAGQTVSVQWTDANVPSGSTISLAYDTTTNWGNPKWIEVGRVSAANGSGSYSWNTAGVATGTYYIAGYLYTSSSATAVFSHLTTSFTVTAAAAAPSFKLSGPASGTFSAGQTVPVQWTDAYVPSGSTISLAYDTTANWGNATWIEIGAVGAANGSGSYNWNTTGLAAGTYYIAGYLYTPSSTAVFSHLTTSFNVTTSSSGAKMAWPLAAVGVGPKLSANMVAAVAATLTSSNSNQKQATSAADAVFAAWMDTTGS